MLANRLTDLRFVIGLFFGIIAVILLCAYAFGPSDLKEGIHVNLVVGCGMGVFAAFMLGMALLRPMN